MTQFFKRSIVGLTLAGITLLLPQAFGGFISSNGMSLLVGLRCSQYLPSGGRTEIQLRYNTAQNYYELRRVEFGGDQSVSVQNLTGGVQCQQSQYPGETVFENRCYGRSAMGGEIVDTVLTIPTRNRLMILWKSSSNPFVEGWLSFERAQCEVVENHLLLPKP